MSQLKHIAVIMDGNGRWAKIRNRPRTYGHIKGARVAKTIISECSRRGFDTLTLYAFSTENWLRPQNEVMFLMQLLRRYLKREQSTFVKQNVRFETIGDLTRLPEDVQREIAETKSLTQGNTGLRVIFAISYGSRQELVSAAKFLARKVQMGELSVEAIDADSIGKALQTHMAPDPDLIIRTSGECRLSNFLLWQAAYSEIYFDQVLWPDFSVDGLQKAIDWYHGRDRRFGKVSSTKMASLFSASEI